MTPLACLLLLLCYGVVVEATESVDQLGRSYEHGCQHIVVGTTSPSGYELTEPCVGFLALREHLCREMWVQGDRVTEIILIPCPVEELRGYLP